MRPPSLPPQAIHASALLFVTSLAIGQAEGPVGVPDDIVKEYGTIVSTMLNGNYLSIPPECEQQIVASLKKHGYIVERKDDVRFH